MLCGSKKGRWVLGRKPDTESHPSQAAGRDAWAFGLALVTGRLPAAMALLTATLQSSLRGAGSWAAYEGLCPDLPASLTVPYSICSLCSSPGQS